MPKTRKFPLKRGPIYEFFQWNPLGKLHLSHPILQRFHHVRLVYGRVSCEIGDRAREFYCAVVAASREFVRSGRVHDRFLPRRREFGELFELFGAHIGVGRDILYGFETRLLSLPRRWFPES